MSESVFLLYSGLANYEPAEQQLHGIYSSRIRAKQAGMRVAGTPMALLWESDSVTHDGRTYWIQEVPLDIEPQAIWGPSPVASGSPFPEWCA